MYIRRHVDLKEIGTEWATVGVLVRPIPSCPVMKCIPLSNLRALNGHFSVPQRPSPGSPRLYRNIWECINISGDECDILAPTGNYTDLANRQPL
eukprot:1770654-Pyramimonas_sp.AAC.1